MQKSFIELAEEEAELRTARKLLAMLIETRFGPLSERSRKKLKQLSTAEVEQRSKQFATAQRRSDIDL